MAASEPGTASVAAVFEEPRSDFSLRRWKGKVAIVTGATSGIGYAIAERLAEEGIIVVGFARRVGELQTLAEKIRGKPYRAQFYPRECDFKLESDVINSILWTKERFGPPHILINSAGVAAKHKLYNGSSADFKNVLDVNVMGVAIASREVIKIMRDCHIRGHIININCLSGHYHITLGNMYHGMYAVSKYALTAMTEQLRKELVGLGSKIKVTSVSPGVTNTGMLTYQGGVPNDIVYLKPQEVAECVLFALATPPNVQVQELMVRPVGDKL